MISAGVIDGLDAFMGAALRLTTVTEARFTDASGGPYGFQLE